MVQIFQEPLTPADFPSGASDEQQCGPWGKVSCGNTCGLGFLLDAFVSRQKTMPK